MTEREIEQALVPVEEIRFFYCEEDDYDVIAFRDGRAIYKFNNGESLNVDHLTEGHINYYVASGYWKIA